MTRRISINDLADIRTMSSTERSGISGRGVSNGYLFSSPMRSGSQAPVLNQFFSIDKFEVNNYETHNHIERMVNQTVNNNQLNLVSVQAGDAQVNVNVNQAQVGANALGASASV